MVYRQLRRNTGWNGNVHNRQPDFHNDVLCPLGDGKLRQLDLRDYDSDGKRDPVYAYRRGRKPVYNLQRSIFDSFGDGRGWRDG